MDGDVEFAMVGESRVAYATHGSGDLDLVYAPGLPSHLDVTIEHPRYRNFVDGLMQFGRVIRFDRLGAGLSDSVPAGVVDTWELWADDLEAVLDATGSKQAVIIAANDAGPGAMVFAATHPHRIAALVLFNTTARFLADGDEYAGHTPESAKFILDVMSEMWGKEKEVDILVPSLADDAAFRRFYARFHRASCSPSQITDSAGRLFSVDARAVLSEIRCPTLVMHRESYFTIPLVHGEEIVKRIPGARFIVMPGGDAPIWTESLKESIDHIGEFLGRKPKPTPDDRVFSTVLFTDIVSSTETAVGLGDYQWRRLIEDYDSVAREAVRKHDGRFIKSTGDGTLATFDRPSRAVRCAAEINQVVEELQIRVRAGIHAGPIAKRDDGDISGLAVNAAARILNVAEPSEVLVSAVLLDLVSTDEVTFTPRGEHELRGINGSWPLYAASLIAEQPS